MKSIISKITVLLIMAMVAGCGGTDAFTSQTTTTTSTTTSSTAATVSLATTSANVKSDNSNSATITATVLDTNNAAVSGVTVAFNTSGGQLSASSATTDDSGQASVIFSSGTSDPTNRTATVTATVSGITAVQIPIVVSGSTLAITSDIPSLIIGGTDTAQLTITAKDAAGSAVYNTALTLSVAGSGASPGTASLTPTSGTTNISGQISATLTATSPGTVTVTATGLGYTATQDFDITQTGAAFVISSPSNPATLQTGQNLTVTVSAPTQSNVVFTSTLGTWDGGSSALVAKAVSGGVASAVLNSTKGGTATVQVTDAADSTTYATLTVLISAPSSQAAQISLQSNVSVVAPSVGGTQSQVTLTATVRTSVASGSDLVSGAPVSFTLSNTTGGGESISPAYGITDSAGQVSTTFTSGSLSSDSTGVQVTATVYDSSSAAIASANKNIIINQTAGSVVIGTGTTVSEPVVGGALYTLPMSVVVADSNGNPVQTTVTLSAWPLYYRTGYWDSVDCSLAVITGTWDNEDVNRNLIEDPGEDVPYVSGPYPVTTTTGVGATISDAMVQDSNGQEEYTLDIALEPSSILTFVTDNKLTPANSAAGTLLGTVTTDASGVANFTLTYAKQYSIWVKDEIRASTTVLGSETTGVLTFTLPALLKDAQACALNPSPFNPQTPAP